MSDLKNVSGLDIELGEDNKLIYDEGVFPVIPAVRTYSAGKSVYIEKNAEEQELYYMYRYFEKNSDAEIFKKNNLEYDITVIKNGFVGDEFIKTIGHYHGLVPGQDITYPEIYEVIEGNIDYILQTQPDENNEVDVIIVKAEAGDKIIIPPNYGHISINPGSTTAVSSNINLRDLPATANYNAYSDYNGGAVFETKEGFIDNPRYVIRSKKIVKPNESPEFGLFKNKSLYNSVIEYPEKFDFMVNPQNYDFSEAFEEI